MEDELVAVSLIANSGGARSIIFEALRTAKEGNVEDAKQKIKEATNLLLEAHKSQTELIQKEARGENVKINVLFVHAQDHLMTTMLAKDLVNELIEVVANKK